MADTKSVTASIGSYIPEAIKALFAWWVIITVIILVCTNWHFKDVIWIETLSVALLIATIVAIRGTIDLIMSGKLKISLASLKKVFLAALTGGVILLIVIMLSSCF